MSTNTDFCVNVSHAKMFSAHHILRTYNAHHTRFTLDHFPLALWCGAVIEEVGHVSQGRQSGSCATFDGIKIHILPNAYIQVPFRRLEIP